MSTPATTAQPGRQLWADVAKGACIVLVVLWHVTRKDYLALPWDLPVPVTGAWGTLSEVLLPVRMPLFFFISGLFAARVVRRPWGRVWTGRIAVLLWLFVLWSLIHVAVMQLTPGFDTAVATTPLELLVQLTITPGNLWFLLALAVYTAVARLTRATPRLAIAGALVLSAVASAGWIPTPGNRAGLLVNLVWFLLGVYAVTRPQATARLVAAGPLLIGSLVGTFAVGAALWQVMDADAWFGVRPLLGLFGVLSGVAVAGAVARTARVGPGLARIGRRTLPIYVIHLPLVAFAHLASVQLVDGRVAESLLLAAAYPAVVTALVVAACLLVQRLIEAGPAWWLLAAPWRGRPGLNRLDHRGSRPAGTSAA